MAFSVEVAVAAPVWQAYSYAVPADLANLIKPLTRMLVPLRNGRSLGFALAPPADAGEVVLKPVLDVLDEVDGAPALPPELLGFFQRAAAYYQAPLGQALAWSLPAGMGSSRPKGGRLIKPETLIIIEPRQGMGKNLPRVGTQADRLLRMVQKQGGLSLPELRKHFTQAASLSKKLEKAGWVTIRHQPLVRDILGNPFRPDPKPEQLTQGQQEAISQIMPAVQAGRFEGFLLDGVTGSGKTEVYLAACEKALSLGRQALVLTPEIGICLRMEGVLKSRLGAERVAVLHSGLSPATRRGQWMALASGRAQVAVGARSAIFAPLDNPGVICVDEEQDEAYKQEDRLRYNARDLALLRGQEQKCCVILGTATPAVTTWQRAGNGEIGLISLPERVKKAALPQMELVDLRSAGKLKGGFLSSRLHRALKQTVDGGNQAILFLNRRGFAPALICPSCGKSVGCPACSLSLTLHKARSRLTCHTCGHQRPLPPKCPACGEEGELMRPTGLGTEAVAEALGRERTKLAPGPAGPGYSQ
jgi:primosomal protein N' (replication factor Y)